MVLYRSVLQAKFGQADALVASMKETINNMPAEQRAALQPRVLTDISGTFFTVVIETTHANLAAVEQFRAVMFANDNAGDDPQMPGLVETGRNEYYTIEYP